MNTKEFIEKAKQIHGDKYDYSETNYINNHTKIKVLCKKCNNFFYPTPKNHISKKSGCPICCFKRPPDKNSFIEKIKQIHGDKYDYSKVNYINNSTKVELVCPKHGSFFITPSHIFEGKGCRLCGYDKLKVSYQGFLNRAKQIHGDKYDYDLIEEYIDGRHKVEIKCNTCNNIFLQKPSNHLKGQGCPYCAGIAKNNINKFIEQAKQIHGDKYDYSESVYINRRTKIKIKCKKCGNVFFQTSNQHIHNQCGCPYCKSSKGEVKIESFLFQKGIKFEREKSYDDLKNHNVPLRFDFYLPDKNILIEYQGKQHFESVKYWGGTEGFLRRQENDELKRQYCINNNISLLEINYKDFDNINLILEEKLR